jgi:hypothetical protein
MRHPSLFTLKEYVDASVVFEADLVAHVSACSTCRTSLARLATRELNRRGIALELAVVEPRPATAPLAAFVAVAAAMAVMVTSHRPMTMNTAFEAAVSAPEGVHGVTLELTPRSIQTSAGFVDGGARLGSD